MSNIDYYSAELKTFLEIENKITNYFLSTNIAPTIFANNLNNIKLNTYQMHIKKENAIAVIEDLQKMEAFEFLSNNDVPQWHIAVVNERLENYKKNTEKAIDFDTAINDIESLL